MGLWVPPSSLEWPHLVSLTPHSHLPSLLGDPSSAGTPKAGALGATQIIEMKVLRGSPGKNVHFLIPT